MQSMAQYRELELKPYVGMFYASLAALQRCIADEELMVTVQRRQLSFSQISNYNSCTGHKHGQTSSRSAACSRFDAGQPCRCAFGCIPGRIHAVHCMARRSSMLPNKQGVCALLLHASWPLCIVSEPVKCLQMYLSAFTNSAMRALGFGTALPLAQQIQMAALGTCCLQQTSLSLGCTSELELSMCHTMLYAIHHRQARLLTCALPQGEYRLLHFLLSHTQ